MLEHQHLDRFAANFPAIAADHDVMARLKAMANFAELPRGSTVCHQGDTCSHLALLTDGVARVFKLAESGREITLYRVEPGECCILTASCMLSEREFPANAVAETDLQAVLVSARDVIACMAESSSWRHFLWNLLATRLGDVIGLVEEVAFRRMDARLADFLVSHVRDHGPVLRATHSQIAAELGTSREVVSRMLKDLEQRNGVKLHRGQVEIIDSDMVAGGTPPRD